MIKRTIESIEIETSTGNVFADLGLPDPEKLLIKSELIIKITKIIRERGLNRAKAAQRMGLSESRLLSLQRGELSSFSEHKLMNCLGELVLA